MIPSLLVNKYSQFRESVNRGSLSVSADNYPFHAFCMGYFVGKVGLGLQIVQQFLEQIDRLVKLKLLSLILVKELLQLFQDHPKEALQINGFLKEYGSATKENLNLIEFIESMFQGRCAPKLKGQSKPEAGPQPMPILENDGTLELEDQIQKDGHTPLLDSSIHAQYDNIQQRRQREEEDVKLARRFQSEYDNEYPLAQEEDVCQICYVNLFDGDVQPLQCGHVFHKNCLIETFKSSIQTNSFPLRCPKDECKMDASQPDLRSILSKDLFEKYQSHTLKAYADEHGDSISWCPTANCGYMFFHEKDDDERFECLECKKEYCLNCRVEWHKDMTCKQYKISSTVSQDDEKFIEFVKGKKFKQCPKCKFWVEKNEGCDHMTCKCKFQFCYKCGGVYMKCECMEKANAENERRRRMMEERVRNKAERKALAIQKKKERQQRKHQELLRKEERKKEDQKNRRSMRKR